jgi:hypothetical protein
LASGLCRFERPGLFRNPERDERRIPRIDLGEEGLRATSRGEGRNGEAVAMGVDDRLERLRARWIAVEP